MPLFKVLFLNSIEHSIERLLVFSQALLYRISRPPTFPCALKNIFMNHTLNYSPYFMFIIPYDKEIQDSISHSPNITDFFSAIQWQKHRRLNLNFVQHV